MARAEPDRLALEIAHRKMGSSVSLDDMLQDPTFKTVLQMVARRHMLNRSRVDLKKLQANDHDD